MGYTPLLPAEPDMLQDFYSPVVPTCPHIQLGPPSRLGPLRRRRHLQHALLYIHCDVMRPSGSALEPGREGQLPYRPRLYVGGHWLSHRDGLFDICAPGTGCHPYDRGAVAANHAAAHFRTGLLVC